MFKTFSNQKTVTISSKGQITLPKAFLTNLDLQSGQKIVLSLGKDKIELFNKNLNLQSKIQKLAGSIKPKIKTNLTIEEQIIDAKQKHFNQK
jgi:AbrB family looped-hinge helix DNA binding protein